MPACLKGLEKPCVSPKHDDLFVLADKERPILWALA